MDSAAFIVAAGIRAVTAQGPAAKSAAGRMAQIGFNYLKYGVFS
jgi:hypothetical protein